MRKTKVFRKHYCFFLLLICIFGSLFIIKPINVFGEDATDTIISQKEKEDLQRYVYQNELVDPLGGFQYKYPLNLPKGINGIAPTLTLVYNSNVGNGMLGMGWYLHGLPEIKRDFSYGAKYSDQDHFLYNGEKLVKGNDGYYRPQRETFERIRPVNLSSSNSYWEVTLKSGTKLYFGYQASEHGQDTFGRICAANDTSKVYLWSLSKVVDIHGNYYIVEYNQDIVNGDYYPIRITYTQNEQKPLTAVRTVEFSYEPRTDHYAIFNPTKVDQDKRLKWITVKMGTRLLRKYRLDYEYGASSLRSRLIGIQEYGCDGDMPNVPWVDSSYQGTGKTLPMTKFGWQQGNAAYGYSQCFYRTDLPLNKVQYTPGDFNGDGKTDLIVTNASGSVWTLSGGVGTTYQFSQPYARYEMTLGNVQYTPGDFNGDGKTDVIVTLSSGSYWYLSTGMDNAFKPYQAYVRTDFTLGNVQFTPGDFNGDGKTDILVTTGSGTYWYYSTGSGNAYQIYQAYYRPELTYGKVQFTPGDYNGDGKTDIIYTTSAGSYWHISLGTGNSYLAYQSGYRSDLKLGSVQYTPGDYNGDGKTDIIVTTSIGSLWYLSVEDGGPNYQPYYRSDLKLGQIEFNPGDFNGDGKTDLLATSSSGSLWYIFRQKNNACELLSLYFRSDLKPGNVRFTLADLNGDGKSDVILTTASNSLGYITSMNSNLPPDVLTTIKSPQGAKISITYTSAADISGAIISDTRTYPDVANSSSAFLVTKLVFDDGLNHQIADSYNYSNRMIHNGQPYEQANLGFAWVEKQNTCNGASRTYYRQDDLDLRMMIDKVEVRGTDSKVYTEKRYEYQKRANSVYPEVNFIYTAADTTFNYNGESGTPVQYRVEYGYDDYGNINLQKDYGDVDVTGDEKRLETQYNYYIGSTNYLILPAVEQAYG
ncbi:MAG TPA: FG-GAP-like repeat-containing protein, partial [Bacillota bacterium]|nr:FG-GAP-like repeat-containing protein [Bacillota bacterium]